MKRGTYGFLLLLIPALMWGCTYLEMTLEKAKVYLSPTYRPTTDDIRRVSPEKCGLLMGAVVGESPEGRPVAVVALSRRLSGSQVVDNVVMSHPGSYALLVPEGTYEVLAFADTNGNARLESPELVGRQKNPEPVSVAAGAVAGGIDVVLSGAAGEPFDDPIDIKVPDQGVEKPMGLEDGGTITLDHEIFSKERASTGLWSPAQFIAEAGLDIYALKEFDRTKMPVLFVHGSGSTPKDWEPLVNEIEKRLYQPWFFYYPSGLGLKTLSDILYEKLQSLHKKYRFERLCITAHSMGGLVVRSFVNRYSLDTQSRYLASFISLSTPWGGADSAELTKHMVFKSIEYVPLCWADMAPSSEFIKGLFQEKLPPAVRFYLFFGYGGDSAAIEGPDDGAIALRHLLDLRAQSEASRCYGFEADHNNILITEEVFRLYNEVLAAGRQSGG
jgi:pimeloyl-ACP methyl ester carboxylesterase